MDVTLRSNRAIASCKFRALNENGAESRQHVTSAGKATLDLLDIELRGADRTCSVAITVLEPGQPAKTIYRGFRLSARTEGAGSTRRRQRPFLPLLAISALHRRLPGSTLAPARGNKIGPGSGWRNLRLTWTY